MANIQQQSLGTEDKDKQKQATTPGPMSSTGAMTPGNVPSPSRTAAFSTGTQPGTGSGRFTNLQSYIGANKPAGEQLGQKVAGTVQTGLEKSQKEATTQAGQIREAIGAEKQRLGEAAGFQSQVEQDPTKIASDAAARQRFQQLTSGATSAGQLQSQAEQAQAQAASQLGQIGQQVSGLGTEAGRFNLLKEAVKQPGYTTGQQRLDQLFLQTANPQALAQKQQALQSQLGQAQAGLQQTYQGPQGISGEFTGENSLAVQAQKAQADLQKALNTQTQQFMTEQQKEAQDITAKNAAANTAMQQFFKQGYNTLTDEQKALINPMLESSGLSAGARTYNVLQDPEAYKKYMTEGRTDLTAANVITPQELTRIQSLEQLAGKAPEAYSFAKTGEIGPQAGIQSEQLASDIQAQADIFNKALNTPNVITTNNVTPGAKTLADVQTALSQLNYDPSMFQGVNQFGFQNKQALGNVIKKLYGIPGADEMGYAQTEATRQMLENYINLINSSGYNAGLGGVTPPVIPQGAKIK